MIPDLFSNRINLGNMESIFLIRFQTTKAKTHPKISQKFKNHEFFLEAFLVRNVSQGVLPK